MAEIAVSLAISAAITAASAGLEYALTPKPKKPAPVDRGKLDDIRFSLPAYGAAIVKGWGTFRVAPIWVWHTPTIDLPVTTQGQSGGKGGGGTTPSPDVTEHRYFKSVFGVFHDGLINKGVSRIWFNSDLVYNANLATNLANTVTTRYEAEHGVLAGGAAVSAQVECSGGNKVTGLGSGGTVTIHCDVSSTASYEVAVHYTSTVDRTFKVSVNGGATTDLVCIASGAASIVAIETITLSLTSGANTIAFSNSGAACPDLDCIDIAPTLTFVDGVDTRSFTGLSDPSRIAPTNPDIAWPIGNEIPTFSDSVGGVTNGGFYSATLSKWGNPQIRIYPGSEMQEPDPLIVSVMGVNNAPAYRGSACLMIEGIQLQNGQMPNVTVEIQQGIREAQTIVSDIYSEVGVASTDLELSALQGLILGDSTGFNPGTYGAISWIGEVNTTEGSAGAISKTSGTNNTWNAYANSGASISAGTDAAIRFTASAGTFMIGFSLTSTPGSTLPNPYNQVPFAVLLNLNSNPGQESKNAVQMSLGGTTNSFDVSTWAIGDQFQVEIRNGRFAAYQNGLLLTGFSPPIPTFPLIPIFIGYATGGGCSAASYASGANIGSEPIVANGGGLILDSQRPAEDLLSEVMTRFQFDLPEVDGKVKAVMRNAVSDLTLTYDEARAYRGNGLPPDIQISRPNSLSFPKKTIVNYLDPQLDFHNNSQVETRLIGPQKGTVNVNLAMVETADNMKKLAVTLSNRAEVEAQPYHFTTGPKYSHVHQGTVLTLTMPNSTHVVRVADIKSDLPVGLNEIEAVRQSSAFSPNAVGSIGIGTEDPIVPIPGNTLGAFVDGPLVYPENAGDNAQPWLYMAMSGRGSGNWPAGLLYREFPAASGNYELVTTSDKPAVIGVTSTALVDVEDVSVTDLASLLVVNFYSQVTLSSVTEAELLANPKLNLLAVISPSGQVEYVQFRTAEAVTATAPFVSKYVLTKFLRGLNDTETNVGVHTAADDVMLMTSSVKVVPMDIDDIGVSRNYKFVTSGQQITDVPVVPYTWNGMALKPHPVTDIRGLQDGILDTLIEFVGHPRLSEQPASFAVDVYSDGTFATLKRSLSVTGATTQAALLVTQNPSDQDGGKVSHIITSSHTDSNNLFSVTGGVTAATLQILNDYYTRIDFTLHDTASPPYLLLQQEVGLIEDGGVNVPGITGADMPVSLEIKQGAGSTIDIDIRNHTTVKATVNYTYTELAAGLRFSLVVLSGEYRVYKDYAFGDPPLAVIAAASGGPPFPLRGAFSVAETLDILDIMVGTGTTLKTIYSAREQIADFGSTVSTVYARIYQKSPAPIPDGWPVDIAIQTAGGHILLETGDDVLTEASDFLSKE